MKLNVALLQLLPGKTIEEQFFIGKQACEKDKKMNSIRYESGAIEDTHIRKKMIDILEGTMPAFDLRSDKYKEHFLRKW